MRFLFVLCVLGISLPGAARSQTPKYDPVTVIRRPFPAITQPKIVEAKASSVTDNELVIGVSVDGKARAYPINQLTGPRREIINDTLGNTPIAATW